MAPDPGPRTPDPGPRSPVSRTRLRQSCYFVAMSAVLNEPLHPHRFTRKQYERMVEAGVFPPGERLELLEGKIVNGVSPKSRQATAICLVQNAMRKSFGSGFDVRCQLPLALGDLSEPEPDIAVVRGSPRDYRDAHPGTALLVVEVADATVQYDRRRKLPVYARAGIPEYWILDLSEATLEVCRNPQGDDYASREILKSGQGIQPQGATSGSIAVADLLP